MNEFTLKATQYQLDTGEVTMHVTHPFVPGGFHLSTLEEELAPGGGNWGNADVLRVGQLLLHAHPVYGTPDATLAPAVRREPRLSTSATAPAQLRRPSPPPVAPEGAEG